jgi:hypothetical protein
MSEGMIVTRLAWIAHAFVSCVCASIPVQRVKRSGSVLYLEELKRRGACTTVRVSSFVRELSERVSRTPTMYDSAASCNCSCVRVSSFVRERVRERFTNGQDGGGLEAHVGLEVLGNLAHEPLKRQLADEELGGLLVPARASVHRGDKVCGGHKHTFGSPSTPVYRGGSGGACGACPRAWWSAPAWWRAACEGPCRPWTCARLVWCGPCDRRERAVRVSARVELWQPKGARAGGWSE